MTKFISEQGALFSDSNVLRLQTDAFLRGQVALGFSPYRVPWDCVWDHGIHEVWGLGVPAFRFVFEAVAHLFGERFPDRITFLIGCSLCYCFLLSTIRGSQNADVSVNASPKRWKDARIAAVLAMLIFAPPFVILLRTRFDVYEEVVAYGYLYSLVLFAGLLRVAARTKTPGLLLLSIWAGTGVWIRPTLLFYGIVTLILSFAIAWRAQVKRRTLAAMLLLFFVSGALQAYSNWTRFGGWAEFGHSLNLDGISDNNFSLKFDYPFRREPFLSAASDEIGTLFFVQRMNGFDWYKTGGILGESLTYRWREMYFTTYDTIYLSLLIGSLLLWLRYFTRIRKTWVNAIELQPNFQHDGYRIACSYAFLAVPWGTVSFICLFGFYLWSPSMASRYNVDFLAAIMIGISALAWNVLELKLINAKTGSPVVLFATFLWLGFGITHSKIVHGFERSPPLDAARVEEQMPVLEGVGFTKPLRQYQLGQPDLPKGIPYNCNGWNLENGAVDSAIILFASDPECVRLSFSVSPQKHITPLDVAPIQAKIGLEYLARESVTLSSNKAVIVFRGPQRLRYQRGVQVCFLGFIRPEDLGRKQSVLLLTDVSFERNNSDSADSRSTPESNVQ